MDSDSALASRKPSSPFDEGGGGHQDTQVTETRVRGAEGAGSVPGLTIVCHPDRSKVGGRLPLPVLTAGRTVQVSRLQPHFRGPGGLEGPLGVVHLSRRPFVLKGEAGGAVGLDPNGTGTPIRADGGRLGEPRVFAAAEISRGVVLELGRRVVLLLHRLPMDPPQGSDGLGIVGGSAAIAHLRRQIVRLAPLDVPVLLRGETGTGKELAARALHDAGPRRHQPFVAVNLAALSPSLAAAELFGAKKGAYTGAHQDKVGYFRKAGGGTLFLDEIGEATAEVQALLLRALETHEIVPVGDTEPQEVAARVIAATDADLESGMADNSFRAALFHRVAGYSLALPPLRDRRDDIGRLFFHFLDGELRRLGPSSEDADCVELDGRPWPEAALVARLARSDWPGNVRQLRNVARWMAVQGPGADLGGELGALVGDESREEPGDGESTGERDPVVDARPKAPLQFHRSPRDVGEEELLAALKLHGWRLKPTASYLRVSRTSLYALIDRCQSIRRAGDLTADELRESCERHGCDLTAMSKELEVSPQGLRHRLQSLGLGPSAGRPNG